MEILEKIRQKALDSLRDGDKILRSVTQTILGEVDRTSPSSKDLKEEDIIRLIQKMIASNTEVLESIQEIHGDSDERVVKLDAENTILSSFLPVFQTKEQVFDLLEEVDISGIPVGPAMGKCIGFLKGKKLHFITTDVKDFVNAKIQA